MDRKSIYSKTDDFIKGRWWSIVVVHIISAIIGAVIVGIFMQIFVGKIFVPLIYAIESEDAYAMLAMIGQIISYLSIGILVSTILTGLLKAGLSMEVLEAYNTGIDIKTGNVINKIKDNFTAILIVVVITAAVNYLIAKIPFVSSFSSIITTVFGLAISFSFFLLQDKKAEDGISAITESFNATSGHKFDLFMIGLYYYFRPFIGLLIMFVGLFFIEAIPTLAIILFLAGLIVMIVLGIKYIPYATVAEAIYYSEIEGQYNQPETVDVEVENETEVVVTEVVSETEIIEEVEVVEPEVVDDESTPEA